MSHARPTISIIQREKKASPERLSHRSHNFFFFSFPFSLINCILPHPSPFVLRSPGQGDQLGLDRPLSPGWPPELQRPCRHHYLPRDGALRPGFNTLSLPRPWRPVRMAVWISAIRDWITLHRDLCELKTCYHLQQIDKTDCNNKERKCVCVAGCELRGQKLALFEKTLDAYKSVTYNPVCHNTTGAVLLHVSTTASGQ